jgi:hypothetical protein
MSAMHMAKMTPRWKLMAVMVLAMMVGAMATALWPFWTWMPVCVVGGFVQASLLGDIKRLQKAATRR